MTRCPPQRLQLLATPPHSCNYLPNRQAINWFVDPSLSLTPEIYAQLVARGFRRSGEFVYRPACPDCTACVPVRVPVSSFRPRRWAQRNLRENSDLTVTHHDQGIDQETLELYRHYQKTRHAGGEMEYESADELERFFYSDWMETVTLKWRLGSRLVAVAIVDRLPEALSAVYTFFDPAHSKRGLGTHAVLQEIQLAAREHRQWLYLGYWIEQCDKMRYKSRFRPFEAFVDEKWRLFDP
ncbi:MAG: arginyltransferase [Gammaproteobacteria bacterium]